MTTVPIDDEWGSPLRVVAWTARRAGDGAWLGSIDDRLIFTNRLEFDQGISKLVGCETREQAERMVRDWGFVDLRVVPLPEWADPKFCRLKEKQ